MNNTVFPFADADHAHLDVLEGMSGVSDDAFPSSSSSDDDDGGLELVESDDDLTWTSSSLTPTRTWPLIRTEPHT